MCVCEEAVRNGKPFRFELGSKMRFGTFFSFLLLLDGCSFANLGVWMLLCFNYKSQIMLRCCRWCKRCRTSMQVSSLLLSLMMHQIFVFRRVFMKVVDVFIRCKWPESSMVPAHFANIIKEIRQNWSVMMIIIASDLMVWTIFKHIKATC